MADSEISNWIGFGFQVQGEARQRWKGLWSRCRSVWGRRVSNVSIGVKGEGGGTRDGETGERLMTHGGTMETE